MKSEEDMSQRRSEFWGICCEGGKKYSQVVRKRFHITMAALDPTVVPTSPVVSLMVDRAGCEYLLCSLKPGSLLQVNLNLYFDKGEKVTFSLKGSGKIHLSGYILHEDQPTQTEAIERSNSVSPTKNAMKMENSLKKDKIAEKNKMEINKPVKDGKKESKDAMQKNKNKPEQKMEIPEDDDSDEDDSDFEVDSDELEGDSDELEGDSDELEELSDDENKDLKEDSNKLKNYKRLWSSLTQSDEGESESSEEDSDEEEEVKEISKKVKELQEKKKLKTDASTPVSNKKMKQNTPEKANKFDEKTAFSKNKSDEDMNSSIGRTPMPKKKSPKKDQANISPKKVNFADSGESSDSSDEVETTQNVLSPAKNDGSNLNAEAKKKKKKKKKAKEALNISNATEDNVDKKNEGGLVTASYSQKLPGGLEYEDIKVGNGPVAKKGKLIHVYYTGMLANSKVFDSRKPGTKPFSFKLGAEQVIKGWDLGIEGMKVGGKRRLKIPPHLGYKNERMGPIPPMSKLFFTVELKAVS